ncbi:CHAT domain-containing protein [Pleurocapsales cyanobacterium LEGE 10410]|nr:CHAT domain-containing protein [Pleurocapsales cyanobacterium LEGE 10410]
MFNSKFSIIRRLLVFLCSAWFAVAFQLPAQSQADALQLAIQAQQLYSQGEFTQAAVAWQQAATLFQAQGDRLGRTKSLINQSQALQELGLYPRACNTLLKAFSVKHPECSSQQLDELIELLEDRTVTTIEGIGLRSLGNVVQQRGMLEQSQQLLRLSKSAIQSSQLGTTLLALGNVQQALGNQTRDRWSYDKITEIIERQEPAMALEPYLDAFAAYEQAAQDPLSATLTQIQARLNYLSLLIEIDNWWQRKITQRIQSWQRLERTRSIEAATNFSALLSRRLTKTQAVLISAIEWAKLPLTRPGIYAQINYAKSLRDLGQTAKVKSILQTALQQARTIKEPLLESYALGYLGQYYGQQGELSQAIALTDRALILAEAQNVNGDAREVSYLWQSQLGQLLEQQGKIQGAIAAYTSAFNTLQSLRSDLNTNNQVVQLNFRREVKPIYLKLASLLLQTDRPQASTSLSFSTENPNSNLELARQVIESLQLAELNNFFQDPCLETANVTVTIDQLDPQAAVIYPIILSDRLEIILSIAGKPLQKFTTPVPLTTVEQTIDLLYDSLYNPSIDNSAVNIFRTIPLNPREVKKNSQTLLPILQQMYDWAIAPLETELAANEIKTLVFVLSGKLQTVPLAALYDGRQYLLEKYGVALVPSLQLLDTQPTPRTELRVLAAGLSEQVEVGGEIFPALDYVPQELSQIKAMFPQSRKLLNQEFTAANIEQQLQTGFPIVHLATHGLFSSDPQQTFIITGDRNVINIEDLSTLLGSSNHTRPELIVLSACDTATGDERAVLGLAGVAVRSGSTTLASLWSVEDASTARLMGQFYRQLQNPATKKVEALQTAQLSLIESWRDRPLLPELSQLPPHPYYWAAYVLVGNWQ